MSSDACVAWSRPASASFIAFALPPPPHPSLLLFLLLLLRDVVLLLRLGAFIVRPLLLCLPLLPIFLRGARLGRQQLRVPGKDGLDLEGGGRNGGAGTTSLTFSFVSATA